MPDYRAHYEMKNKLDEMFSNFEVSNERKKELLSKDIIIYPKKTKGKDILKLIRNNDIDAELFFENEDGSELVIREPCSLGVPSPDLIFYVLNTTIIPLFTGILTSWIFDKYIKNKHNFLSIWIYQIEENKTDIKKFEGKAEDVLKALKKDLNSN